MDRTELHKLIEDYFEGNTTLEQERELRRELSKPEWDGDTAAEEARAVAGFSLASAQDAIHREPRHVNSMRLVRICTAAAAIAVLAIIGGHRLFFHDHDVTAICYAYVDGDEISDQLTVMSLLDQELSDIAAAAQEMDENIDEECDAIETALSELETADLP